MKLLLFLVFCVSYSLYSDEHKTTEVPSQIRGIVVTSDSSDLASIDTDEIEGIQIKKMDVPGGIQDLQDLLVLFIGKELTEENIFEIKEQIISYFQEHDRSFLKVDIPEQDVTNGVVGFTLTEAKVAEICFEGNKYFPVRSVKKYLHVKPGETISKDQISNDIAWMNRNPFHRTEAIFSPGEESGSTDLKLVTNERFPLRFYLGGDNTGNDFTGNARYFVGFNWGNAFFLNDLFTYQFMTADDFHKYTAHALDYTSYFPWQHALKVWGGYASIHPKIRDFDQSGKAAQISFRYVLPYKPLYTDFLHELDVGADYKYQNNALFFTSELLTFPVLDHSVNLTQVVFGYRLRYTPKNHEVTFRAEAFLSPGEWLPNQRNSEYNKLRRHAKSTYLYIRAAAGDIYQLPLRFALAGLVRAQISTNTLLPSEEFGLGGYDSVRGYDENEILADAALCLNFEIRTPPIPVIAKVKNELYFLAFMDYGLGCNIHSLQGERNPAHLWSIGPGVRYTVGPYLTFRVDYGFQLHHTLFHTHHLGKVHLGLTASY